MERLKASYYPKPTFPLKGDGRYINNVVIQQHPIITQESDKTIRVECSFDAGDQQVSFAPEKSPGRTGGGIDIAAGIPPLTGPNDVSDVVSNTAPTPGVVMNIYKISGDKANSVDLGETLELRIEMRESSAFGILARNLEARTEFGELMTLIDNLGCPRYPEIFSSLQTDENKALFSRFKAFRFPSTGRVNFVATIKFCQEKCENVNCGGGIFSLGKKRRRRSATGNETAAEEMLLLETVSEVATIAATAAEESEVEITTDNENYFTLLPTDVLSSPSQFIENMTFQVSSSGSINSSSFGSNHLPIFDPKSEEKKYSDGEFPSKTSATKRPPLPNDVPVALSLVVGDDEPILDQYRKYPGRKETYMEENYICSPTSTILAATITLLVLICASVASFAIFYRMKKRQWRKLLGFDPYNIASQS